MIRKQAVVAPIAALFLLANAPAAQARWFQAQPQWWSAGRACIGARGPAARRWQVLPPRSCRVGAAHEAAFETTSGVIEAETQDFADAKASFDGFALALPQRVLGEAMGKGMGKIERKIE